MKAYTLYQPFATLVAIGAKKIETRGRRTNYRGSLAIHAGKCTDYLDLCAEEPFRSVLKAAGFRGPADLPLGAVVAIVDLTECRKIVAKVSSELFLGDLETRSSMLAPLEPELSFGDYTVGRCGLFLENVRSLFQPIPARGMQGIWEWAPPEGFRLPEVSCG